MQTLVIGDIHGCHNEFQALLDKVGLTEDDSIVSVGDCVDRGPDTPAVLRFFQEKPNIFLIMGNHERKHVRADRHEVKLARSQKISKIQFGETYPNALTFMSTLPLYLDLPDALVAHGYFEPGLPLTQQLATVLCGTMGGDKHLRTKFDRHWYELYDGDKPLLVGHHNYSNTDQPFIYQDRVFGLDTDCVTGKALTGLLLPSFKIVSVPSRANYWAQVRRTYSETKYHLHLQGKKWSGAITMRKDCHTLSTKPSKEPIQSCWSYILSLNSPTCQRGNRQNYSAQRREMVSMEHCRILPA